MIKVFKSRKIIVLFTALISILFGILIFNKLSDNNINFIIKNANNLNYINMKVIIFHILLLNISFVLAFLGIGIIFLLTYLFFEGVILGFMCAYFTSIYSMNGLLYSFVYILIFKALLMFLIVILIFKYLKIFRSMIKYIKKQNVDITKTIINTIIINLMIIALDLFLLLFGKSLLNIFSFIIK